MDNIPDEATTNTIVRICVPTEKGMVIAAGPDGSLTCATETGEARDDQWLFVEVPITDIPGIPDNRGFNIVSANFKMVMDYNPSSGEQIAVVLYNQIDRTHTIWHVSDDNEIYTYDNFGNRKYLWSALGNIYVTPDEHLAECWQAVSLEGFDTPMISGILLDSSASEGSLFTPKRISIILVLLILLLLIYLFRGRLGLGLSRSRR